jgi:hypothetical protein
VKWGLSFACVQRGLASVGACVQMRRYLIYGLNGSGKSTVDASCNDVATAS